MNTGQMMIILPAMMQLVFVILIVNNWFRFTNILLMETNFSLFSVSQAAFTIEDAAGKDYDYPCIENDYNSVFRRQIRLAARNLGNR